MTFEAFVELYTKDGGRIRITYPDREPAERVCRFIDKYHTDIGGYHYHICEFAERMEQIGAKYVPLDYVREPEFYEKYYVVIPFNQPEEKVGLWDMPENIIRP